ncbi:MAG TPA: T9SS type A sorting domain-containing protein, partial [Bacteroidales bacterium]|nr:T9SS type A sorting domain-containing protein [Bacteroidales bacterium]
YKLIEFDFDGYRDELGVVAVNSSNKDGMLSVSIIQSNDSKIYFDVYNISGNRLWVELTDLNGNILTEQQFEISEPIVYRLSINVNKGFYLLKVSDSKNLVVKKLIR